MRKHTSAANTRWRDVYGRAWVWATAAALAVHAFVFFFLFDAVTERLHEALIPGPSVFVQAGGPGAMESVALARPPAEAQSEETPPEPEEEEEAVQPTPSEDVAESITIAEVSASPAEGAAEGVPEGEGDAEPAGSIGAGACAPRPLHLAVPRVPDGLDKTRARGQSVHLLIQVLADGTVGEVRVEEGSRFTALDEAALDAARRMRYQPCEVVAWTRAEMRF